MNYELIVTGAFGFIMGILVTRKFSVSGKDYTSLLNITNRLSENSMTLESICNIRGKLVNFYHNRFLSYLTHEDYVEIIRIQENTEKSV